MTTFSEIFGRMRAGQAESAGLPLNTSPEAAYERALAQAERRFEAEVERIEREYSANVASVRAHAGR